MEPPPVRAVFFDLFDTLIRIDYDRFPRLNFGGRERPTTAGVLHEAYRAMGHDVTLEKFATEILGIYLEINREKALDHREVSSRSKFERLLLRLGHTDPAEIGARSAELAKIHMSYLVLHALPMEGALDVLAHYSAKVPLVLISNFDDAAAGEAIVDRTGLRSYLKSTVFSEAVGLCKPRRELYDRALAVVAAEPAETVMVGDTHLADVHGPRALGIRSVWLNPKGTVLGETQTRPDWEIRSLPELLTVLKVGE